MDSLCLCLTFLSFEFYHVNIQDMLNTTLMFTDANPRQFFSHWKNGINLSWPTLYFENQTETKKNPDVVS